MLIYNLLWCMIALATAWAFNKTIFKKRNASTAEAWILAASMFLAGFIALTMARWSVYVSSFETAAEAAGIPVETFDLGKAFSPQIFLPGASAFGFYFTLRPKKKMK